MRINLDPMKFFLSIVVPCFNEKNVFLTNLEKAKILTQEFKDLEIIFLDNGSSDGSREIFKKYEKSELPGISFCYITKNKGYGYGIKYALKNNSSEFVGWTHGDGQTDLLDIRKAISILKSKEIVNLVKGTRKNRSKIESFISIFMGKIATLILKLQLNEINAQPSIYRSDILEEIDSYSDDLLFDLDAFVFGTFHYGQAKRFNVFFPKRRHGKSSWNKGFYSKIKFIIHNLKRMLKIRKELARRSNFESI